MLSCIEYDSVTCICCWAKCLGSSKKEVFESNGNSSCKIEEIEDEASSVPNINKAQCKNK